MLTTRPQGVTLIEIPYTYRRLGIRMVTRCSLPHGWELLSARTLSRGGKVRDRCRSPIRLPRRGPPPAGRTLLAGRHYPVAHGNIAPNPGKAQIGWRVHKYRNSPCSI